MESRRRPREEEEEDRDYEEGEGEEASLGEERDKEEAFRRFAALFTLLSLVRDDKQTKRRAEAAEKLCEYLGEAKNVELVRTYLRTGEPSTSNEKGGFTRIVSGLHAGILIELAKKSNETAPSKTLNKLYETLAMVYDAVKDESEISETLTGDVFDTTFTFLGNHLVNLAAQHRERPDPSLLNSTPPALRHAFHFVRRVLRVSLPRHRWSLDDDDDDADDDRFPFSRAMTPTRCGKVVWEFCRASLHEYPSFFRNYILNASSLCEIARYALDRYTRNEMISEKWSDDAFCTLADWFTTLTEEVSPTSADLEMMTMLRSLLEGHGRHAWPYLIQYPQIFASVIRVSRESMPARRVYYDCLRLALSCSMDFKAFRGESPLVLIPSPGSSSPHHVWNMIHLEHHLKTLFNSSFSSSGSPLNAFGGFADEISKQAVARAEAAASALTAEEVSETLKGKPPAGWITRIMDEPYAVFAGSLIRCCLCLRERSSSSTHMDSLKSLIRHVFPSLTGGDRIHWMWIFREALLVCSQVEMGILINECFLMEGVREFISARVSESSGTAASETTSGGKHYKMGETVWALQLMIDLCERGGDVIPVEEKRRVSSLARMTARRLGESLVTRHEPEEGGTRKMSRARGFIQVCFMLSVRLAAIAASEEHNIPRNDVAVDEESGFSFNKKPGMDEEDGMIDFLLSTSRPNDGGGFFPHHVVDYLTAAAHCNNVRKRDELHTTLVTSMTQEHWEKIVAWVVAWLESSKEIDFREFSRLLWLCNLLCGTGGLEDETEDLEERNEDRLTLATKIARFSPLEKYQVFAPRTISRNHALASHLVTALQSSLETSLSTSSTNDSRKNFVGTLRVASFLGVFNKRAPHPASPTILLRALGEVAPAALSLRDAPRYLLRLLSSVSFGVSARDAYAAIFNWCEGEMERLSSASIPTSAVDATSGGVDDDDDGEDERSSNKPLAKRLKREKRLKKSSTHMELSEEDDDDDHHRNETTKKQQPRSSVPLPTSSTASLPPRTIARRIKVVSRLMILTSSGNAPRGALDAIKARCRSAAAAFRREVCAPGWIHYHILNSLMESLVYCLHATLEGGSSKTAASTAMAEYDACLDVVDEIRKVASGGKVEVGLLEGASQALTRVMTVMAERKIVSRCFGELPTTSSSDTKLENLDQIDPLLRGFLERTAADVMGIFLNDKLFLTSHRDRALRLRETTTQDACVLSNAARCSILALMRETARAYSNCEMVVRFLAVAATRALEHDCGEIRERAGMVMAAMAGDGAGDVHDGNYSARLEMGIVLLLNVLKSAPRTLIFVNSSWNAWKNKMGKGGPIFFSESDGPLMASILAAEEKKNYVGDDDTTVGDLPDEESVEVDALTRLRHQERIRTYLTTLGEFAIAAPRLFLKPVLMRLMLRGGEIFWRRRERASLLYPLVCAVTEAVARELGRDSPRTMFDSNAEFLFESWFVNFPPPSRQSLTATSSSSSGRTGNASAGDGEEEMEEAAQEGESSLSRFPYELFGYDSISEMVCAHLTTLIALTASHHAAERVQYEMVQDIFSFVPRAFFKDEAKGDPSRRIPKRFKWKHSEIVALVREQIGRVLGIILPLSFTRASSSLSGSRMHPRLIWGGSENDTRVDDLRSRTACEFLVKELFISLNTDFKTNADQILSLICREIDLLCEGEENMAGSLARVDSGCLERYLGESAGGKPSVSLKSVNGVEIVMHLSARFRQILSSTVMSACVTEDAESSPSWSERGERRREVRLTRSRNRLICRLVPLVETALKLFGWFEDLIETSPVIHRAFLHLSLSVLRFLESVADGRGSRQLDEIKTKARSLLNLTLARCPSESHAFSVSLVRSIQRRLLASGTTLPVENYDEEENDMELELGSEKADDLESTIEMLERTYADRTSHGLGVFLLSTAPSLYIPHCLDLVSRLDVLLRWEDDRRLNFRDSPLSLLLTEEGGGGGLNGGTSSSSSSSSSVGDSPLHENSGSSAVKTRHDLVRCARALAHLTSPFNPSSSLRVAAGHRLGQILSRVGPDVSQQVLSQHRGDEEFQTGEKESEGSSNITASKNKKPTVGVARSSSNNANQDDSDVVALKRTLLRWLYVAAAHDDPDVASVAVTTLKAMLRTPSGRRAYDISSHVEQDRLTGFLTASVDPPSSFFASANADEEEDADDGLMRDRLEFPSEPSEGPPASRLRKARLKCGSCASLVGEPSSTSLTRTSATTTPVDTSGRNARVRHWPGSREMQRERETAHTPKGTRLCRSSTYGHPDALHSAVWMDSSERARTFEEWVSGVCDAMCRDAKGELVRDEFLRLCAPMCALDHRFARLVFPWLILDACRALPGGIPPASSSTSSKSEANVAVAKLAALEKRKDRLSRRFTQVLSLVSGEENEKTDASSSPDAIKRARLILETLSFLRWRGIQRWLLTSSHPASAHAAEVATVTTRQLAQSVSTNDVGPTSTTSEEMRRRADKDYRSPFVHVDAGLAARVALVCGLPAFAIQSLEIEYEIAWEGRKSLRHFYEVTTKDRTEELDMLLASLGTAEAKGAREGEDRAELLLSAFRSLGDTDSAKGAKRPSSLVERANESMFEGEWVRALGGYDALMTWGRPRTPNETDFVRRGTATALQRCGLYSTLEGFLTSSSTTTTANSNANSALSHHAVHFGGLKSLTDLQLEARWRKLAMTGLLEEERSSSFAPSPRSSSSSSFASAESEEGALYLALSSLFHGHRPGLVHATRLSTLRVLDGDVKSDSYVSRLASFNELEFAFDCIWERKEVNALDKAMRQWDENGMRALSSLDFPQAEQIFAVREGIARVSQARALGSGEREGETDVVVNHLLAHSELCRRRDRPHVAATVMERLRAYLSSRKSPEISEVTKWKRAREEEGIKILLQDARISWSAGESEHALESIQGLLRVVERLNEAHPPHPRPEEVPPPLLTKLKTTPFKPFNGSGEKHRVLLSATSSSSSSSTSNKRGGLPILGREEEETAFERRLLAPALRCVAATWMSQSSSSISSGELRSEWFERAVEECSQIVRQEQGSRKQRAEELLGRCHAATASFVDRQYRAIVSRLASPEWLQVTELQKRREKQLQEDEEELRQRRASGKQQPPNAAAKKDDKTFERKVEHLRTECSEDRRERESVESSSQELLKAAMHHYLRSLHFIGASSEANRAIYRVLGLWFANWKHGFTSELMREAFLGSANAHVVPTGRLVPLVYQLTSRLCAADLPSAAGVAASHSSSNSNSSFKSTLEEMITRMCVSHPFHCLPHLYAFYHGDRVPGSNSDAGSSSSKSSIGNSTASRKVAVARTVISRVEREGGQVYAATSRALRALYDAFIDLAYHTPPGGNKNAEKETPFSLSDCNSFAEKSTLFLRLAGSSSSSPPALPLPLAALPSPTVRLDSSLNGDFVRLAAISKTYILTAQGINCPKVVTMMGDDGRDRRVLVKGNDDLRQDAVLEQLFAYVSAMLAEDPGARARGLRLRTYNVLALAPLAGMIEWVEDTISFGGYLYGGGSTSGFRSSAHFRHNPTDLTFVDAYSKLTAVHSNTHVRTPEEATLSMEELKLKVFREVCAKFRPVFRHFFYERYGMGEDARMWYERRRAYTRSTAVNSMVGMVLGIGDRHSQNILVDVRTAEVVHIDFGVAFEQGKLLTVPEVVPFRLTNDVVDGMGVSGVRGGFSISSEETLRVLRENAEAIVTICEVFLHDPLHRWTAVPRKKQVTDARPETPALVTNNNNNNNDAMVGKELEGEDGEEGSLDAGRVIHRLRHKLQGFVEDSGESLDVASQVKRVVNEASSEDALSRMYPGWAPFM